MPRGLKWVASDCDRARPASLAAAEAWLPTSGSRPESLPTWTRLPPPLSSIAGTAARLMRRATWKLRSKAASPCLSVMSRKLVRACSPPALLSRASVRPGRSSTVAITRSGVAGGVGGRPVEQVFDGGGGVDGAVHAAVVELLDPLEGAERVSGLHECRRSQDAGPDRGPEIVGGDDVGGDGPSEGVGEGVGDAFAVKDVGREPVALAGVSTGSFGEDLGGHGGEVLSGDQAARLVADGPCETPVPEREGGQEVLHEHVRGQVGPGDAAALDVALDELLPLEVGLSGPAVTVASQVHQLPDAGVRSRVGDRLGLVAHGDRVAGHDEEPVDAVQGGGEGAGVIEVEAGCGEAPVSPLIDGGLGAGGAGADNVVVAGFDLGGD